MVLVTKPKVEKWRDVVGWEGWYQVSNWGFVKNVKTGRAMTAFPDGDGYLMVKLTKQGKGGVHKIHVLVAKAFCKNNAGDRADAHHRNDIKTCNWSTNLRYLTRQQHFRGHVAGRIYGQKKLTKELVKEMKFRYRQGCITQAALAKEYKVSRTLVGLIVRWDRWPNVKTPKA